MNTPDGLCLADAVGGDRLAEGVGEYQFLQALATGETERA
jgi:hypothetical protein